MAPGSPEFELRLVARMDELAAAHPRYGYRRVWALLRGEGFEVNHKRVERLWRLGATGFRAPAIEWAAGAWRRGQCGLGAGRVRPG